MNDAFVNNVFRSAAHYDHCGVVLFLLVNYVDNK